MMSNWIIAGVGVGLMILSGILIWRSEDESLPISFLKGYYAGKKASEREGE